MGCWVGCRAGLGVEEKKEFQIRIKDADTYNYWVAKISLVYRKV
jgi:hypothetical protein